MHYKTDAVLISSTRSDGFIWSCSDIPYHRSGIGSYLLRLYSIFEQLVTHLFAVHVSFLYRNEIYTRHIRNIYGLCTRDQRVRCEPGTVLYEEAPRQHTLPGGFFYLIICQLLSRKYALWSRGIFPLPLSV